MYIRKHTFTKTSKRLASQSTDNQTNYSMNREIVQAASNSTAEMYVQSDPRHSWHSCAFAGFHSLLQSKSPKQPHENQFQKHILGEKMEKYVDEPKKRPAPHLPIYASGHYIKISALLV